jgi:hypothetical protein
MADFSRRNFLRTGMAASLLSAGAPAFCLDEPKSLKYTRITAMGATGVYTLFSGTLFSSTEYILGRNSRSESPLRHAVIRNSDAHYIFDLDLEAKAYTEIQVDDRGIALDAKREPIEWKKPSGRTRHYHTETVDTGERREMFGYTARHLEWRRTLTMEPPGDSTITESEGDGWFIDPPAALLQLYPKSGATVYNGLTVQSPWEEDAIRYTRAGPRETGFPIVVTYKIGRFHEKVVELSEDAIDPAMFQPPADFKRVAELPSGRSPYHYRYPWETRVWLRWQMLMDWL